jgi:hypothetical protein
MGREGGRKAVWRRRVAVQLVIGRIKGEGGERGNRGREGGMGGLGELEVARRLLQVL